MVGRGSESPAVLCTGNPPGDRHTPRPDWHAPASLQLLRCTGQPYALFVAFDVQKHVFEDLIHRDELDLALMQACAGACTLP